MKSALPAGEALLQVWLSLTAVLCGRRMVTGMTFNEAVVCNHLLHQSGPEACLTATDLCQKTGLLKSQMNGVLSGLEEAGYLRRQRSDTDRRRVELRLTESGLSAYESAHKNASALLQELTTALGEERITRLTAELEAVYGAIDHIQHEKGTL